ncbi:MAG: low molecular weight phosphotyrosine protein phosphatase [Gammaproteobacteria bacterium]|nr:low molecular weight phosphotyrosine protein phosphatase [Gammaproteobacteria bacterium]
MLSPKKISVLMVCLGNICRSPVAQGVLVKLVKDQELEHLVEVDSAGTGDWHIGSKPDLRAIQASAQRGYDIDHLRARQVKDIDFSHFDYILAMDQSNIRELERRAPAECNTVPQLILGYIQTEQKDVPDPYYGGAEDFELVLDLVEEACIEFLKRVFSKNRLS